MKKLILPLLLLLAVPSFGQNLITNGDFESDAVASGDFANITTTNGTLTGWTVTSGDVDIVGAGNNLSWITNSTQCIDLHGLGRGIIKQSFTTTPSAEYLISFKYSANPRGGRGAMRLHAVVDGHGLYLAPLGLRFETLGDTRTNDVRVSHSQGWTETNFTFTATGTSHDLMFIPGHSDGNTTVIVRDSGGPLIDDVSVTVVP